jgi:hypothetical protein
MTCDVQDEILKLHDSFYVESVTYSRKPHTTTKIETIRPQDLVWADGLFDEPAKTYEKPKKPSQDPRSPHALIAMPIKIRQSGRNL